ncbi:sensor domain-containing protein [Ralstonia sp. 25C]|uniref:sensor domain-containing protein n=1 Tax=Ralstonia sp. 25C TaxID=3447363 RepID=UPI003F754DA3
MTLNIEHHPEQFSGLAKEIDAIARELESGAGNSDINPCLGDRLLILARRLRELPPQLAIWHGSSRSRAKNFSSDVVAVGRSEACLQVRSAYERTLENSVAQAEGQPVTRETLAASERQFKMLAENLPAYLTRHNVAGEVVFLNAKVAQLAGQHASSIMGRSPMQIRSDDTLNEYQHAILETVRTGSDSQFELNFTDENGQSHIHLIHTVPERDETGAVMSVLAMGLDITGRRRVEQDLKRALDLAEGVIAAIPDILFEVDRNGTYLNVWTKNPGMLALPKGQLIGSTVHDVLPPEQAAVAMHAINEADTHGVTHCHEILIELPDGSRRWFEHSVAKKAGEPLTMDTFLVLSRDITERKHIEEKLATREREFRTLVENSPDTIARYGADLRRMYANPTFAASVVGGMEALIGMRPSECPGGRSAAVVEQNLSQVFATARALEFEVTWTDRDGSTRSGLINLTPELAADGQVETILAVGRDITELSASREKIHRMAFYDPLTLLPNRASFNETLSHVVAAGMARGQLTGVVMIDMDRFKRVNDTMGHQTGDQLLRDAAQRLSQCAKPGDVVARFGGDEFAILVRDARSRTALEAFARAIIAQFEKRFVLGGKDIFVSCSIGIALYPNDSIQADDLMKYADSAMYLAKRSGRRGFRFYSRALTEAATERLKLESELRGAIEREELELHYQPKVLLATEEVSGWEALLRWRRPDVGWVPPNRFIPIAEETGMIAQLGEWVLRQACRSAADWNARGAVCRRISVNLSVAQFQFQDLVSTVTDVLEETGCRPEWLEFEITESLLLERSDGVFRTLSAFRSMGISIAIDDFGTGYSALGYLTNFPIDVLKIDRSFVCGVTTDSRRAEVVKAILSIADCLGMHVVAEGVETPEQAAFLAAHGCRGAQGFLYGKPVPKSARAV